MAIQNQMIRIDNNPKMAMAIERAKLQRMHVRSLGSGSYSVLNGSGKLYTVQIVRVKGMVLAGCDCANQNRSLCKHMAVAAGLDRGLTSHTRELERELAVLIKPAGSSLNINGWDL